MCSSTKYIFYIHVSSPWVIIGNSKGWEDGGGGGGVEIEGKDDAKLNRLEVCVLVGGWGEG